MNKESEHKNISSSSMITYELGDIVKYKHTGTIGVIINIEKINNQIWALLDSTDLYYNVSSLEKVQNAIKTKKIYVKNIEEDIEEKIRIRDEISSSYSAENIDAPGGAG